MLPVTLRAPLEKYHKLIHSLSSKLDEVILKRPGEITMEGVEKPLDGAAIGAIVTEGKRHAASTKMALKVFSKLPQ